MTQKHTNVFSKCFSAVAEPKVAINIRESEEETRLEVTLQRRSCSSTQYGEV